MQRDFSYPDGKVKEGALSRDYGSSERPVSCTRTWINLAGLGSGLVALYTVRSSTIPKYHLAIILSLAVALTILVLEAIFLETYRAPSTGLDWSRPASPSLSRVALKLLGLFVTLGAVGLGYWVLPEYHGPFYVVFWEMLRLYGPWALLLSVPYVWFVDGRMRDPYDAYWHLGRWFTSTRARMDAELLRKHVLGWLIKAFFVPLMFVYLVDNIGAMQRFLTVMPRHTFLQIFDLLYQLAFFIDLLFAIGGYILTLRLVDTHLRSAEPTMLGWVSALICYQPFFSFINANYLAYAGSITWGPWLIRHAVIQTLWGCVILFCIGIYAWATVTFGCRFSNLTHRGILTNGPYRFSKHPAYIGKNISMWMISIPFIANDTPTAIRHCILLALIGGIYIVRAYTEERHLSRDPVYVAYALWMNDHGLFRWVARVVPFLRYQPPVKAGRVEEQ